MTGGAQGTRKTTELFDPLTKSSCEMPSLPSHRSYHSLNKNILCGDAWNPNRQSCLKLNEGTWVDSHTLAQQRYGHSTWNVEEGFYIIGGSESPSQRTTELVKFDGGVEQGFDLKYKTA